MFKSAPSFDCAWKSATFAGLGNNREGTGVKGLRRFPKLLLSGVGLDGNRGILNTTKHIWAPVV
jgi:hypothetical protein